MPSRPPPVKPLIDKNPGCSKCTAKRCVLCDIHLVQTSTFTSVRTGHSYSIRDPLGCKSSNLIYLVDCGKCRDVQYVGETGNTLQKRFHGHRSDIGTTEERRLALSHGQGSSFNPRGSVKDQEIKRETLVARHFQLPDHSLADLWVTAIEQIKSADVEWRRRRERFWRHKLRTNYPDGLNVWD